MKLSSALASTQRRLGLTTTQLAKRLKVSPPGLYRVLAGTAFPNARTEKKYATFLGISVEKLQKLAKHVIRRAYKKTR